MGFKRLRSAVCISIVGIASIASGAALDTIKGLVSDSVTGDPMDSVTVVSENTSTSTNALGIFTIVLGGTGVLSSQSPQQHMPSLSWHPESNSFTWSGYSGDLSITVYDLRGNSIARTVSEKNRTGTSFSLGRLSQGIYTVAIEAQGRRDVYTIYCLNVNQGRSFSIMSRNFASGPFSKDVATTPTTLSHVLTYIKGADTLGKTTVPAGTQTRLMVNLSKPKPVSKLVRVFDGTTKTGWKSVGGAWNVNTADSALQMDGSRSYIYTEKMYTHFRATFKIKQAEGGHRCCVLFVAQQPGNNAEGESIQFQMPPASGGWDYRRSIGHDCDLGDANRTGGTLVHWGADFNPALNKWYEAEAVVNMAEGWVEGGIADPIGSKCKSSIRYTDQKIKSYKAAPLSFQCHGGEGRSEFKDIFIEENPTNDTLLMKMRP